MYRIYSKEDCVFCTRAKQVLRARGLSFEEVNISSDRTEMDSRVEAALGEKPKTVPQIFDGETYVGGFEDLVRYVS